MGSCQTQVGVAAPDIYESLESLELYLADVRERRRQRGVHREKRRMLEAAITKVGEELVAAREDQDEEIEAELQVVLAEFTRRLDLLEPLAAPRTAEPAPVIPRYDEAPTGGVTDVGPGFVPDAGVVTGSRLQTPATPALERAATEQVDAATSEPERADLARALLVRVEDLAGQFEAMDAEGLCQCEGILDRACCFRLRALACRVGEVHARAREDGPCPDVQRATSSLRDRMDVARTHAGDVSPSLPFDDAAWAPSGRPISSADWHVLADRYEQTAQAQDAYCWFVAHQASLSSGTSLSLLNSSAAAQQGLYRELERLGGSCRLQIAFYGDLRDAARNMGYLSALSSDLTLSELDQLARGLPDLLAAAQRDHTGARDREAKLARRTAAIQAVVEWRASVQELAVEQLAAHGEQVLGLLAECQSAGVPPTNLEVRAALLDCGPSLLADQPQFAKILDAVLAERKRKGMDGVVTDDGGEEGEPTDAAVEPYVAEVSAFVAGQRVLILGGVPRAHICEELKEKLGDVDVEWVASKKSDKAAKFQAEIKRASILLVVKNFAGHDMSEKGREWIKSVGGHFVLLPGGYGVNQIIYQLYRHVTARSGNGHA